MIFIVQQYVSDKNVGNPIKYSQKYLYQISIPHQIPKNSTEDEDFLLHSPTSLPQTGVWHCSTLVLQRREKRNATELPKRIQIIYSRKKGKQPRFDTLQYQWVLVEWLPFTLWHCLLPNCYKKNFCERLYWN